VVRKAHADRPCGPAALRNAAGIAAEHRVSRVEHQNIGPELRTHLGYQFFQQAGGRLTLAALCGIRAAHQMPSSLSKTDAATLTATPLRTPRACR
jgi:hypothetical protein